MVALIRLVFKKCSGYAADPLLENSLGVRSYYDSTICDKSLEYVHMHVHVHVLHVSQAENI